MSNFIKIFNKNISTPKSQTLLLIAFLLLSHGFLFIVDALNLFQFDLNNYYTLIITAMMIFSIFNSIISLSSENRNTYWLHSLIGFILMTIIGCISAYLLSGMTIDEAGSFRWLILVFSFGYILFISIVRVMRKIVELAQKQDGRLRGEE